MNYIKEIETRFQIKAREQRSDLHFISVDRSKLVQLITWMRDVLGFRHLVFLTAVDYPENEIMRLTYMVHSYNEKADVGILVELPRKEPVMESIHHLWRAAATYQRELFEMFGIDFPGSPDKDVPFILESWGDNPPPMRRDFDTRAYSEKTYYPRPGRLTHDPTEHMAEKIYPKEKGLRDE